MIRIKTKRTNRTAFTLIELLVVMAIIAILAGLILSGVMKVMSKIPEVQTRTEIAQMDVGIRAFMQDYGLTNPPPSYLYLREDGKYDLTQEPDKATVTFLRTWLSKSFNIAGHYDWNGNGQIDHPYVLYGQQCLVFYLGGIPTYQSDGSVSMTGFGMNTNPTQPTSAGATRHGPYFNFISNRLTTQLNVFTGTPPTVLKVGLPYPVYIDAWNVAPSATTPGKVPYAFFSSQGKFSAYNLSAGLGWGKSNPYYASPPVAYPNPNPVQYAPLFAFTDNPNNTGVNLGGDCAIFIDPASNPSVLHHPNAPSQPAIAPGTVLASPNARAYYELANGNPMFTFNNTYQIISAGADGVFGSGGTLNGGVLWQSSVGATGNGRDDQANFASGILAAGQ